VSTDVGATVEAQASERTRTDDATAPSTTAATTRAAVWHAPWLHWLAGAALGGVFVFASWDKILHPAEFARIVYHYQLIGPSATIGYLPANLLAVTLPWVELLAGALLIANVWRRDAAALCGAMLVMFLVAVGYALSQGINIENCGCFNVSASGDARAAGLKLILQDLGLLAMAAFVTFVPARNDRA